MARLTGRIIEERYAPGVRENSLYQDQPLGREMAKEVSRNYTSGILYYVDKKTGGLRVKNTKLSEW